MYCSRFVYAMTDAMASPALDPSLIDSTNVLSSDPRTLPIGLPTPPSERKRVNQLDLKGPERKRVKLEWPLKGKENAGADVYSDSDSEGEGDVCGPRGSAAQYSVYGIRNRAMQAGPSSASRRVDCECQPFIANLLLIIGIAVPTRSILQTFVSSNKSDVFKCHSIHENLSVNIPYACSYSNGELQRHDAIDSSVFMRVHL